MLNPLFDNNNEKNRKKSNENSGHREKCNENRGNQQSQAERKKHLTLQSCLSSSMYREKSNENGGHKPNATICHHVVKPIVMQRWEGA